MIKCCIFDLDGTLLNTLDTIAYYVNLTFQNNNIKPLAVDVVKGYIGHGARALIKKCMLHAGAYTSDEFYENVYSQYEKLYNGDVLYLTQPYDGILELVASLKARGIKLGVLSNKTHSVTFSVVKQFFGESFDLVYGAMDGVPLKPDPTMLVRMGNELGASLSEIAYFGDMVGDIKTGKNAGVAITGCVLWGFAPRDVLMREGADAMFDTPSDILGVI